MAERPRFSTELEPVHLEVPPGKKLGGAIAGAFSPEGDFLLLHQWNPPGMDTSGGRAEDYLPDVARFGPGGKLKAAWGGPDHIPQADGVPQWPAGREGIECDAQGQCLGIRLLGR